MIRPTFVMDPASRFTILDKRVAGGVGAQTAVDAAVPAGLNRLFLFGHVEHNDGANPHVLNLLARNPAQTLHYAIPLQLTASQASTVHNPVLDPFMLPAGWILTCASFDAIAVGAQVEMDFGYIDFLIE